MDAIYKHPRVAEIQAHYGDLLYDLSAFTTIRDHFAALAKRMHEGVKYEVPGVLQEINNYHKDFISWPHEKIIAENLTLDDCRKAVSNLHSFSDWQDVESACAVPYDVLFEKAINHLLSGESEALNELLLKKPGLVNQRSQYGHHAMLIHYCGSNGVELWRQQVPRNLLDIAQLLLDHGVDKAATFSIYGGQFDVLAMASSSAHPFEAGVSEELVALLKA